MFDGVSQTGHLQINESITVTANAEASDGQIIYYNFYYCANYGTNDYDATPWTVVQDYSTSNNAVYTFPSAGNYIIVVRAVTDPDNDGVDTVLFRVNEVDYVATNFTADDYELVMTCNTTNTYNWTLIL